MTMFLSTKEKMPSGIRPLTYPNTPQKLFKLETLLMSEPNLDGLAKISHFMQEECCIGVERKYFL